MKGEIIIIFINHLFTFIIDMLLSVGMLSFNFQKNINSAKQPVLQWGLEFVEGSWLETYIMGSTQYKIRKISWKFHKDETGIVWVLQGGVEDAWRIMGVSYLRLEESDNIWHNSLYWWWLGRYHGSLMKIRFDFTNNLFHQVGLWVHVDVVFFSSIRMRQSPSKLAQFLSAASGWSQGVKRGPIGVVLISVIFSKIYIPLCLRCWGFKVEVLLF